MKKKREISLSVIPFSSEIIGVDEKFVYLRENYFYYDEMPELEVGVQYNMDELGDAYPCVVKIERNTFIEITNLWLDTKSKYFKQGMFLGVFGNFSVEKYKEIGKIDISVDFDEEIEKEIFMTVPIFQVVEIDKYCDMERG